MSPGVELEELCNLHLCQIWKTADDPVPHTAATASCLAEGEMSELDSGTIVAGK